MDKIIDLSLPEKCRILAVSDIHTHWQLFDRLLKKAKYDPQNDYLVIVGDILEHGSDNIKALEYVKALCDKSDKAILLMGNNDIMCSSGFSSSFTAMSITRSGKWLIRWDMLTAGRATGLR